MEINVKLTNCYGIKFLDYGFDFAKNQNEVNAFAVYAPNGLMKTSFTKTFEKLALKEKPAEERYNLQSDAKVLIDGKPIPSEYIYVVKSEIDIQEDTQALTDILVDPESKARYDKIQIELLQKKSELIKKLQSASGVNAKNNGVEDALIGVMQLKDFSECVSILNSREVVSGLPDLKFSTLFDEKASKILQDKKFLENAREFSERYHELFIQEGSFYRKGVFSPTEADTCFDTLERHGFFKGGHRVQLQGENTAIDKSALDSRLAKINARIDGDEELKNIRTSLAKNSQVRALQDIIESLTLTQVDELIENLAQTRIDEFKKDLWAGYIKGCDDATSYVELWKKTKDEIRAIEKKAE